MITKIITPRNNSNSHNLDFQSQGRKVYTKPEIVSEFLDDNMEWNYVLSNGNTQLQSSYDNLWNPPKTAINWKAKGDNPDKTKIV